MKALNNRAMEMKGIRGYADKMEDNRDMTENMQIQIARMEQKEVEMLEKLKSTQVNQRKAYSSLEKMVSVGYNYYSQCYDLKQKKTQEVIQDPRLDRARAEMKLEQLRLDKVLNGNP